LNSSINGQLHYVDDPSSEYQTYRLTGEIILLGVKHVIDKPIVLYSRDGGSEELCEQILQEPRGVKAKICFSRLPQESELAWEIQFRVTSSETADLLGEVDEVKKNQYRDAMARLLVQRIVHIQYPENYKPVETYPRFEVAEVESGFGTFAPRIGRKYSFDSDVSARSYVAMQRALGFEGHIEVTRMDNDRTGAVLFAE
jgi:hypothetical protein